MNNKQKIFLASIAITIILIIGVSSLFFADPPENGKLNLVATFYPLAFLSQEIGGDYVQVTQLVPSNTEIHGWEPSASNILSTENADIIVYNGAGLDHWLEDEILPSLSSNKNRAVIETTHGLELLAGEAHEHEESTSESEENEHGLYDPHTWVSPYMAILQAQKIYDAIVQADPDHESYYAQRWQTLEAKLAGLDTGYKSALSNAKKDAIFVSHEAFGYLASRYGFEQHGVIGLSADEQPSASTIANLINTMKEQQIYTVFVDPVYSSEYAQTIKTEFQAQTGQSVTIMELYLMLGETNQMDLLEQMQVNLDNLKVGLEAT
jgi:zinc transport system substrate-binding protein